jgi:hypothetical protein
MRFERVLEGVTNKALSRIERATAHLFANHRAYLLLADVRESQLGKMAESIDVDVATRVGHESNRPRVSAADARMRKMRSTL